MLVEPHYSGGIYFNGVGFLGCIFDHPPIAQGAIYYDRGSNCVDGLCPDGRGLFPFDPKHRPDGDEFCRDQTMEEARNRVT